jgi:hypothetical protein
MIDFFLSPANIPFVISLGVMLAFTLIEIVSTSVGLGLSELVDSLLPEFDADIDLDIEADADVSGIDSPGDSLSRLLAWFRIGEVPVVMLLIIFLTSFGLSGLILQYIMFSVTGMYIPAVIAAVPAFLASIPAIRFLGGLLGKYMPKDETYVVSEKSFIGMVATITLGQATVGKPAQAKLKDRHGQTHYLMVEPANHDESFPAGETGLIVSQQGSLFKIIRADNAGMSD